MSTNELCYVNFTAEDVNSQHKKLQPNEVKTNLEDLCEKKLLEKNGSNYNFTENGADKMYCLLLTKYQTGGRKNMSIKYLM